MPKRIYNAFISKKDYAIYLYNKAKSGCKLSMTGEKIHSPCHIKKVYFVM